MGLAITQKWSVTVVKKCLGLLNLSRLDHLCELELDCNPRVMDDVVTALADGCPGLQRVSFAQAGTAQMPISEHAIASLAALNQLTHVSFYAA